MERVNRVNCRNFTARGWFTVGWVWYAGGKARQRVWERTRGGGGMADTADLKSASAQAEWGFESPSPYQIVEALRHATEKRLFRMAQASGAGEIYPGVTVDPAIVHGKPVLTGTRILVSQIVGHLAAGDSMETVCDAYGLTPEQVRAALGYAASRVASEEVYVVSHP